MSGPAERFGEATPRLSGVESHILGDHVHRYVGTLSETGERVRVLALAPDLAERDAAVDAFGRVCDQWANAGANENILAVRDRDTAPRPWIAVPETSGETLEGVRSELSPMAVETVVNETADALRTLGLYNTVHGHLSPSDIHVAGAADDASEPTVKVGGFGLDRAVQAAVGETEPTPYTAPELVDRSSQPTERTDVYGLGAVTYFALTGQPPVETTPRPPSTHTETVSDGLDGVVRQALSEQPSERQESPYAFSRAFRSCFDLDRDQQDTETGAAPGSPDEGDGPDPADETGDADGTTAAGEAGGTRLTRRAAVGVLGVGALGGGAVFFSGGSEPDRSAPPAATDPADTTGERTPPETNTPPSGSAVSDDDTPSESEPTDTPSESEPTDTPSESEPTDTPSGQGSAEFADSVYPIQRGDVATVTVEFENTDVATLQIGTLENVGYAVVARIEDGDADGVATVEFDSYDAASGTPSDALSAGDADTIVSNVTTPEGSYDGNQPAGSDLLDPGSYTMLLSAGPKTDPTVDIGDADAVATLAIEEA